MMNPLIFVHAILAEIGLFAFLWVLVELLNPTGARIERAKIGAVCLLTAWLAGGFYYVEVYGSSIKPVIKASEAKWVHSIVMGPSRCLYSQIQNPPSIPSFSSPSHRHSG